MGRFNPTGNWIVLRASGKKKDIAINKRNVDYVEYHYDPELRPCCGVNINFTSGEVKYIGLGDCREDVDNFLENWFKD